MVMAFVKTDMPQNKSVVKSSEVAEFNCNLQIDTSAQHVSSVH